MAKPRTVETIHASRRAEGKEMRRKLPRNQHSVVGGPDAGPDVLATLTASDEGRIPELIPLRYERMLADPMAFLRGAVQVMSADLARRPNTGIMVQLCGDAHLANFGMFATPERRLAFGVNDFDETLPGPWDWDVKRLVVSLHVAGRTNGLDEDACSAAVRSAVAAYRNRINALSRMAALDVWYSEIDVDVLADALRGPTRKRLNQAAGKARTRDRHRALGKLTEIDSTGRRRFRNDPPLLVPLDGDIAADEVASVLEQYVASLPDERRLLLENYRVTDTARKVVGVGSVGTWCMVALLEGPRGGHVVMQVKEARESALEPYLGPSRYTHRGQRVVIGQRLMQSAPDLFLGWTDSPATGRHFYVRQLWDMKGSAEVASLDATTLGEYGALCGIALAIAHARSGDPSLIAGYIGRSTALDDALAACAAAGADRNEQQYAELETAARAGRVPVADL